MFSKFRQSKWFPVIFGAILIAAALVSRLAFAHYLANDEPNDGKLYAQIAVNILERNVYSVETEAPFTPTLIRLPGYPLFIAAVYAVFGHENNEAVRLTQAVFDTLTCVLIALIAFSWANEARKSRAAFWAFLLAAFCPFTAIYVCVILTETPTTFLSAAMILTATYAFKSAVNTKSAAWWFVTGIIAGAAVTLRPDSGLFAAAIGITLVTGGLFCRTDALPDEKPRFLQRIRQTFVRGAIFSLAFLLPLVPWTVRNERLFGVFQPLAPAHAEMPGEFVPQGFSDWVRTWIDDQRYIQPTLWNLEEKPIIIEQIPADAFDSDEERERVAALLDRYNHPPNDESNADNQTDSADSDGSNADSADDSSADGTNDQINDSDENADAPPVKMTPEIDAGFEQIARERIAREPFRYYAALPAERAAALWFDTHSTYYPFAGELFPTGKLDRQKNQQFWLPLFAAAVWLYTLLAFAGGITLFRNRKANAFSLRPLILAALIIFPRIVFLATLENPEPRYVVELFAVTAILGGIAVARINFGKGEK